MNEGFNKSKVKTGLKFSLGVSILASILLIILTMDENTIDKLMAVNIYYLVLAVIICFLMWFVGGLRTKLIANALEEKLSLKAGFDIFLVGAFVSNVTPFASGGGPVQVLLLHRKGISLGKSSTIIIIQFVLRLLFFGILAPILFLRFKSLIKPGIISIEILNLAILLVLLISVIIIYFIWQPDNIKYLTKKMTKIRVLNSLLKNDKTKGLVDKFYQEMEEFHNSLWQLTKYKRSSLIWAGLCTIIFWGLFFTIAPVILLGLGAKPFFLRSFVMQTIFYLILPYIPTPGGSGVAELGFASFFASFVPKSLLGLLAIVWRSLTFYLPIILGGLILLRILGLKGLKANN
ncbi:hypothetical protein BX659_1362 [Orenia metallireducens]|uniref:Phosphatidylglycerol lysyltransferase n=2 Tax=Orenia TaxID=46468 RepID=A0A285ICA7_9FIRM|nr:MULTISPECIES: lysylphosphatidylglycerol synthase transmembrane domain-containing protein [Orenia]PRX20123.1 hypothetical protein BX659_1362 [Orenia metallireducens]TDX48872.1 hypothetical protein C7959_12551 [Orenia marismortui]SNY45618.1 hypothetical protein SAMN06265827_1392 [Orenia metallireducens]